MRRSDITKVVCGLIVATLGTAAIDGCAHPVFVAPTGSGTPAPDAATAWNEALSACGSLKSFSSELRISGRVANQKLRATVFAGITADEQIRLEMPVPFGRPVFVLAGTNDRSTLVTRDNHVLIARADEIIEALTGLPFGPRTLLAVLSGCGGVVDRTFRDARRYDTVLALDSGAGRVFLRQTNARWRVIAADIQDVMVAYEPRDDDWPRELRISSAPARVPSIALSVSQGQIEPNANIATSAFTLAVPAGATEITLQDLRAAGPLGQGRE
jgi:hypothetical protein